MKTFINRLLFLLLLTAVSSCTKVIDLDLGDNTGAIVIEGNITDRQGTQYVKLSQNVPFSNTNNYPPVTGATVTVSDGVGNTHTFTEGPSGTYSFRRMAGVTGSTYTLVVTANAKTYKAVSVMPAKIELDSITAKDSEFNTSKHKKIISVHYLDRAGVGNQYRFVMFVNKVQVKTVYAINDDFTDGRDVSIILRDSDDDDDTGIYAGDTVTVEMQCIDKPIYTYWFSLMQQGNNGPGGGVTPADPPTNITPKALGYFSVHTTQTKTIIVK
jgi:hypothetical protein